MRRLLFVMLLAALPANAADTGIQVTEAWSRATAPQAQVGGGYVTVRNNGDTPDRLVGASSEVAQVVELHEHLHENGVMKMRPVAAIEIPAHGSVAFAPGGYHIMLLNLKAPLAAGRCFPVTLAFEKAGPLTVQLRVEGPGARGPTAGGACSSQ